MGDLEDQHRRYGDRVAFFIVYIKEAHPEDGWVLEENREDGIALLDPTSLEQRAEVASVCSLRLPTGIPMLLDGVENRIASTYGGWPDRLYLIGRDGRVAYQGGEGPYGFLPDELETAIRRELARTPDAQPASVPRE